MRRLGGLSIGIAMIAAATVVVAPSTAAGHKCRQGALAVNYLPHGHRTATVLCMRRPETSRSRSGESAVLESLLSSDRLLPPQLRKLLPPFPATAERAFRRAHQKRVQAMAAGASGATTSSGGTIAPGPDQVGTGSFSNTSTTSTTEDKEHATVRYTHEWSSRHEVFGPKCADFDGNVVTKLNFTDRVRKSVERRGKRTVVEIEFRNTGTLSGGFTDAFELKGDLHFDLELVVETRSWTEIAATHKVVSRESTKTDRIDMNKDLPFSDPLAALPDPVKTFTDMTVTGAGGPKGILTPADFAAGGGSLAALTIGTTWIAQVESMLAFGATISNMASFGCVSAQAAPTTLTLPKGQQRAFTVTVHGRDDQRLLPSTQDSRIVSGALTLAPLKSAIHGPANGVPFTGATGGGNGAVSIAVETRRGRAEPVTVPINEQTRVHFPAQFDGTWTRVFSLAAGGPPIETVTGHATFVRDQSIPPAAEGLIAIPYPVSSATVEWTVTGSVSDGGCFTTYSGGGSDQATENSAIGRSELTLEDVSTKTAAPHPEPQPYYYSISAEGNPLSAPMYNVTRSGGAGCANSQEPISVFYLGVGDPHDFATNGSPVDLQKSSDIARLEGHRTFDSGTGLVFDDTWSFTGSG